MAKPKRGKNAKTVKGWRGTCPLCERERVKLLWEKAKDEKKYKVCKHCGKTAA